MGTVTNIGEARWHPIEQLYKQAQMVEANMWHIWRSLGQGLASLRDEYPANQDFGAACFAHGVEYSKDTRAAIIWLGELSDEQYTEAREMFPGRASPWGLYKAASGLFKVEPCSRPLDNAKHIVVEEPKVPDSEPAEALEPVVPEAESDFSVSTPPAKHVKPDDVLRAYYPKPDTKALLGKLTATAKKEMAAWASKQAGQSEVCVNVFSPRLFAPSLPRGGPSSGLKPSPKTMKQIRQMIAHADDYVRMAETCSTKSQCDAWWAEHIEQKKLVDVATLVIPAAALGPSNGNVTCPATEGPMEWYGKQIWPRGDGVAYEVAWNTWHFFQDNDRAVAIGMDDAAERGRHYMPLRNWWQGFGQPGAHQVWFDMAVAMRTHPEKVAECYAPPPPTRGQ